MNSGRSPFTKHGQLAKRPECDNLDRNLHYRFPYPRDAARDHGVHDPFFSFLPLPSAGGNPFHRKHDATVRSPARTSENSVMAKFSIALSRYGQDRRQGSHIPMGIVLMYLHR
jgi:hypothetical protein